METIMTTKTKQTKKQASFSNFVKETILKVRSSTGGLSNQQLKHTFRNIYIRKQDTSVIQQGKHLGLHAVCLILLSCLNLQ